jgi:Peptidase family S41/N-terminal domain of Peptidase_S41 in eukaryotic IRBP
MKMQRWLVAILLTVSCFAEQRVSSITPTQADSVVQKLVDDLGDYIFPEMARTLQAYVTQHRSEYRAIENPKLLADKLTADLRAVGHDHHLQVTFGEELGIQKEPTPEEKQRAHAFDEANGYGIRSARRLPGNIGYIDLAYFSPDEGAGKAVAAAMQLINGTDALVIDLRRNGGGSGETATDLLSYFFEEPQQLSSIIERKNGQLKERQKWTMPYVDGPRYVGKPIYILTSSHTHSAAELCAYDLKSMQRATIVGSKTAGDANSSRGVVDLGFGFTALVPNGQTKSPITHGNWEGTGVEPDLNVNADEALLTTYTKALQETKPRFTGSEDLAQERLKATRDPQAALKQELGDFR